MATNARIERLTREALGRPRVPMQFPPEAGLLLVRMAFALITLGAIARGLDSASPAAGVPQLTTSFIGVVPGTPETDTGNVSDLSY